LAKRKKIPVVRTNTGTAVYPFVNTPDKRFEKKFGVFRVTLRLPKDDAAAKLIIKAVKREQARELKAARAEESSPAKRKRIKTADLPYIETDDGEYIDFNFKGKAGGKREDGSKWSWRPALFDASGTPIDPKKYIIGGGSQIKVAYRPRGFYVASLGAGCSLMLVGVQVIKFVAFGGPASWETTGFSEEDGESLEDWEVAEDDEDEDEDDEDEDDDDYEDDDEDFDEDDEDEDDEDEDDEDEDDEDEDDGTEETSDGLPEDFGGDDEDDDF
jgi:hypothetical protein